jgi:hypothetical protein
MRFVTSATVRIPLQMGKPHRQHSKSTAPVSRSTGADGTGAESTCSPGRGGPTRGSIRIRIHAASGRRTKNRRRRLAVPDRTTSGPVPTKGACLTLRWVGVASRLRAGLIGAIAAAVVVFAAAFLVWQIVTPGVEQAVGSAFAGSRPLLAALLGPGTGLAVAVVLAVGAAALVALAGVLVPLFYRLAAARTGGVGLVLAAGE